MEYRFLGDTGLKVSVLGFGNWLTAKLEGTQETSDQQIQACWDGGVNFYDTAEIYADGEAEIVMGNSLKKLNVGRDDLVVSTKLWKQGTAINSLFTLNRKHIIEGAVNSLKRLQLDYVDVIYAHRYDHKTPIEETCRAFDWLIKNGKAFYWGTSAWRAEQIFEAYGVCDRLGLVKPVVEQPEYHMFDRETFEVEYSKLFSRYRMGSTIWSPLAGGLLTGKYNNGIPEGSRYANVSGFVKERAFDRWMNDETKDKTITKLNALTDIAKELDSSLASLAIAWTIANKDVSVCLLGASNKDQVVANLKSVDTYRKLTPEILERIEKILDNRPYPGLNNRDLTELPARR